LHPRSRPPRAPQSGPDHAGPTRPRDRSLGAHYPAYGGRARQPRLVVRRAGSPRPRGGRAEPPGRPVARREALSLRFGEPGQRRRRHGFQDSESRISRVGQNLLEVESTRGSAGMTDSGSSALLILLANSSRASGNHGFAFPGRLISPRFRPNDPRWEFASSI